MTLTDEHPSAVVAFAGDPAARQKATRTLREAGWEILAECTTAEDLIATCLAERPRYALIGAALPGLDTGHVDALTAADIKPIVVVDEEGASHPGLLSDPDAHPHPRLAPGATTEE